jgi:hypothetical protein
VQVFSLDEETDARADLTSQGDVDRTSVAITLSKLSLRLSRKPQC